MRYRNADQESLSEAELLRIEIDEHNSEYAGHQGMPFGMPSLRFSTEDVWRINDHAYKKGSYVRGFRKRRLFEMMDARNLQGKRVLDVGCGSGQHAVFFAMCGAEVVGFDVSDVGIEIARQMAKENGVEQRCRFEVAEASATPFEDGAFDVVVHNAVLHHILKYPNIREETLRVVAPGGRVFVTEGLRENPIYRAARAVYRMLKPIEEQGDVDLGMADILAFTEGFEDVEMEQFCLFEGVKAGIAKPYDNALPTRAVIFAASVFDRALLAVAPSLRRYCSEIIVAMRKPVARAG